MSDRRRFLRASGLAVAAAVAGCSGRGSQPTTTTEPPATQLTLNNVGKRAWELTDDESGSVGPTGEENPTLTFSVGTRYRIANEGWSSHPFALRAADDSPLVSQDADGSFESDDAVNWVDEGGVLAFTVTEELAGAVDYYICTTHAKMRGSVETN